MNEEIEIENAVKTGGEAPTTTVHISGRDKLQMEIEDTRRRRLESVLMGEVTELDLRDFGITVEVDTVLREHDHLRLIRAACLAYQYCLVVGNEIHHRDRTGMSPLENLPRLVREEGVAVTPVSETRALPSGSGPKHEPSVYVELAEQGFTNTEIADFLGDVTEASVRRGLKSAGYRRSV